MCACTAAERGHRVLLIEKMHQPGLKLRLTGKGRCNLTNVAPLREAIPHIGPDARWLRNCYGRFYNQELMQWFEQRGVELTVERGGRVYPKSGRSLDIFLALVNEVEQSANVTIRKSSAVVGIAKTAAPQTEASSASVFTITLQGGERVQAQRVVLATGGLSYPTTGSTGAGFRLARELGHTTIDPVPALLPLRVAEKLPSELVGFQLKNVQLNISTGDGLSSRHSFFGEMTFCSDGLAGPIAISASRVASRPLHEGQPVVATLDLKPALSADVLDRRLQADFDASGSRIFNDALRLWLPAELVGLALRGMHVEYYKRLNQINAAERHRIGQWLKAVPFTLTGTHGWEEAIITQGGVPPAEVNPKTMESRLCPGLYIIGELLNLDADTGGYNLQIAFSTAHAAGMAV